MFKTTIKNLAARKLRLLLTATSVVLGVGFIAGTFVLTDTMNVAYENLFTDATSGVDVYVRAPGYSMQDMGSSDVPTVPEALLHKVKNTPGVESAEGALSGFAQFIDKAGEPIGGAGGAQTLGTAWTSNEGSGLVLRAGEAPNSSDEVVIDAQTAETNGFDIGDSVRVLFEGPVRTFEIVGIAGFGEADSMGGATMAVFDLATAQEVVNKPDGFDSIEVTARKGVADNELVDQLAAALPDQYSVSSAADVAAEQAASLKDSLGFFTSALLAFAAISVIVGAFIIFNTFSIVISQRMREFALLKSLGASGRQVMRYVLLEAGAVGLLASVAGLGAGVGIAAGLKSLLATFGVELPSAPLQFLPRTVVVSIAVGTLVTLVASIMPARKAARVSPMAALRDTAAPSVSPSKVRTIIGIVLAVIGMSNVTAGAFMRDGAAGAAGSGVFLIVLAGLLLNSAVASRLARWIGAPFARLFGTPAKLAQENAARNPKRTAATAGALMIGLSLVSVVGILGASIKATTERVLNDSVQADYILSSGGAMMLGPGFPHSVVEDVSEIEGVSGLAVLTHGEIETGGKAAEVAAIDARDFKRVVELDVTSGELAALGRNDVIVEAKTAAKRSIDVGDKLPVRFTRTGKKTLEVVAVFEDKGIVNSGYAISHETYMRNFRAHMIEIAIVQVAPGADKSEVGEAIEAAVADYPTVEVKDQDAFIDEQAAHIDELFALITALLGLALLISVFGITNTLALSVYERIREIGLLRAVGMLRRQMKAAIRWEAFIVAMIGAFLGVVIGIALGWAIALSLESQGITEFAVPGSTLAVFVLLAGAAGVIASLPPARRAARLNVLEAIATQ